MSDRAVYDAVTTTKQQGRAAVLVTIIRDQGSVPRHAGSKMLVYPDGLIVGTIGGGEMESRVIAAAPDLIKSGKTDIMQFELVDLMRGDPGVCGGQVELFLEPILPDPTVLVIGCGHVGQAVVELAHWLGFRVIASDDRADLCNPDKTPYADEYLVIAPDDVAKKAAIHERTYIAAVTRGAPLDVKMLPSLLSTPARYIGVIGSRRRWATAVKGLKEQGFDVKRLESIHAPIGLELNAETPREIAVSIMAEIVGLERGGGGEPMRWIGTPEEADNVSK